VVAVMRCGTSTRRNDSCIIDNNCFHSAYAKGLHLALMSCLLDRLIEQDLHLAGNVPTVVVREYIAATETQIMHTKTNIRNVTFCRATQCPVQWPPERNLL
jgi:hypothetical protein